MKPRTPLFVLPVVICAMLAATAAIGGDHPPHLRPFKGGSVGEVTFPASTVCEAVTGADSQALSSSLGQIGQLGRAEVNTTHCSTLDGSAAVGGEAVFTAANGDEIWATYTANTVAWPEPPLMLTVQEAEFTRVGGTGRLELSSGHVFGMVYVTFEGLSDPSGPLEFVFAGMTVY
jgi:hypothetical protein